MKKLLIVAAIAGLVGTANAQSAFEGAFGQLGIGYQSSKPNVDPAPNTTINPNNGFAATVGLGYNFSVSNDFLLGIGAEYGLPSASKSITNDPGSPNYKYQNTYNIFLTPGFAINKESLVYAKVGYTGTTLKVDGDQSYNLNGYSLGLGYKQIISGGFYGFAEGNYLSYSKKSFSDAGGNFNLGTSSYNLLVGVGYKF